VDSRNGLLSIEIELTEAGYRALPAVTDLVFDWIELQRKEGPLSYDLYNECNKVMPPNAAAVSTDKVPVIEIDADGEVVTGFIVADNYFELYVNGKLVSVDNTPYTPFNSAIVKFKVKRPYTMAFLLVDWDEQLGLGVENMARLKEPWYLGDGGLIAKFSDGTVTDSSWKAQTYMVGPLDSPNDVVDKGNIRLFNKLGRTYPHVKKPECRDNCYMVHSLLQKRPGGLPCTSQATHRLSQPGATSRGLRRYPCAAPSADSRPKRPS
jgi:hypothetical protein